MMNTSFAQPICLLFSVSTFLCATQVSAKEFYKWVDAKGSTHYTTTPPPKNVQHKGKVNTYSSSVSTQASAAKNDEQVSREAENREQQQADQQREANEALRQGQAVAASAAQ